MKMLMHNLVRPKRGESRMAFGKFNMVESRESVGVRVCGKPMVPSVDEVGRHSSTHKPFRSWCRYCAMGKANDGRHVNVGKERRYAVILIYYTYIIQPENSNPILVAHDDETECIAAFVVPAKVDYLQWQKGWDNGWMEAAMDKL